MKYTITAIKAKGLWLVCDSAGICLRVAVTRSQAERIVAQLTAVKPPTSRTRRA